MRKRGLLFVLLMMAAVFCLHSSAMADEGKLPDPQFTLDSSEVVRGDFLAVRITNMSEYETYMDHNAFNNFKITATPYYEPYGEWYESFEWNGRGTIWVPTQSLNPEGHDEAFTLHVNALADGMTEGYAETTFTVTEPQTGSLNFTISDTEVVTREEYTLSVYAPGADEITIHDPYRPIYHVYSDSCMTHYGYNYTGEYSYYATATYYDEETGESETRYSDSITVNVTAPYGDVTCTGVETQPILAYGEDLTLEVGESPSGYESWNLNVHRSRDHREVWHSWGNHASVISVPAVMPDYPGENCDWLIESGEDIFEDGEQYDVSLGLFRYGYEGYSYNAKILIGDISSVEEGITVKVNDQMEDLTLPLLDMAYVEVEGPADATALLIYNGHEWKFQEGNYAAYTWAVNSYSPLQWYLFLARYTTDAFTQEQINAYDFDFNDLTWSGNSNVVKIDCIRNGDLPDPEFTLDQSSVIRGDWITATITNLEDFASYEGISFYAVPAYDPWGQGGNRYYWDGEGAIHIPTADLDPANKPEPFTLHVYSTMGNGWKEGSAEEDFTVEDNTGAGLQFEVASSTVTAPEDITFSAYAPGAAELSIWQRSWNDDGTYHEWPMETRSNTSHLILKRGTFTEGTYTYFAAVKYPGDEDWTQSGLIDVTVVAPNGDVDVEIDVPRSVPFGEDLTLHVSGLTDDSDVGLRVMRADDNTVTWHAWGNKDTWIVPSVEPRTEWLRERLHQAGETVLEDGVLYNVEFSVSRPGYNTANLKQLVLIGEGSLDPVLSFSENGVLTSIDIQISASAPGADRMVLDVSKEGEPNWNDRRDAEGENAGWGWSSSDEGTYHFILSAWVGETFLQSEEYTVSVSAPYGDLEAPTLQGIPSMTQTNTDISGSFTESANARDYHIRLNYCPDGEPWELIHEEFRNQGEDGLTSLNFPGNLFDRAGVYTLQIHSHAVGFNGGHLDHKIMVMEAGLQQSLVLTVNNEGEEIYLHQNWPVTVSAPEGVTAVRLWSSSRDWWDCRANTGDGFEWYWGFHEGGEETLIAQATTDASVTEWLNDPSHDGMWDFDWSQVSWTMVSNTVTVNVIKYGDLEAPLVTFPQGTTVERGQMLDLVIEPVENAYSYGVQVRRADDEEWRWLVDMDYSTTETILIHVPTDSLEAGDYMVHIDPRCYGWHGDSIGYPFTVTQGSSWTGEPVFRVNPTEIRTQEPVTFSIYAPGASEVALRRGNDEWFHEWGENLADYVILNWAHPYQLEGWAYYPGEGNADGEWQQVGSTIEVNVTAPNGVMGLTVDAPSRILTSDVLTFDVVCDYQGTEGSTECFLSPWDGPEIEPQIVDESWEGGLHYITYQVDANMLEAGPYFITVYAIPGEPGYEIGAYDGVVRVTAGNESLDLPSGLNVIEEEAFAGVAAEKIVVPSGVTTIASNAFTDCPNLVELVLPEGITSFAPDALGSTGPVFVYGQEGGYLEAYAQAVDNLYFVPVD